MSVKPTKPVMKEIETTGHVWDGIEELNTPMPRWWLWTFIATIIWGLGYTVAYPAWPLITGATPGVLGSSTRADVAADIQRFEAANSEISAKLASADLTTIATTPELQAYATSAGAAIFRTNCSQCHGSGAAGVQASGYPNLLDDDWLWGGDIASIHTTITHGVRNDTDPDARFSQMPAFGDILEKAQIDQVVQHVLAISGQDHDAAQAGLGAAIFGENCASCHGEGGIGNREFGAPNLTDAIWLYGKTPERLLETVTYARNGVMPNWNNKLSETEIRAVAAYVHQLGGGE
jgi:cytochrome c oxidase cbb3-type subunit III